MTWIDPPDPDQAGDWGLEEDESVSVIQVPTVVATTVVEPLHLLGPDGRVIARSWPGAGFLAR